MLHIRKELSIHPAFDFRLLGIAPEEAIFFDIETTGLSSYKSGLYLIGLVRMEQGHWILEQYFCESVADEVPVLHAFFQLLPAGKLLISFNGDGFDIPFLRQMVRQYDLPYSFACIESFDIFKKIKPSRKLLQLPNLKLKTLERFLGIQREDLYSGGELIQVYFDYLKTRDQETLQTLLLHNAEDLENLPAVLELISYSCLPSGSFQLESSRLLPAPHAPEISLLDLSFRAEVTLPVPLDWQQGPYTLNITSNQLELVVELFQGELKYFYPDYKEYYYLPVEDYAVHRSLGEFVDPKFRRKATRQNCYQRKNGLYLPQTEPVFSPVFQEEYRSPQLYTEYQPDLFQDGIKAQAYLRTLLNSLKQG